jgi:4,4'-diaponeurosporenoate glycosyltransferase
MTESWAKACLQGAQDSGPGVVLLSVAWMAGLWSTLLLVMTPLPLRVLVLVYLLFALQLHRMGRWLGGYRTLTSLLFPIPLAYFCIVFGYGASRRALGGRMMWRGREV